jgi:multidrug efflux system outer membrane protein
MEYQRTAAINRLNFLVGYAPVTLSRSKTLDDQGFDIDITPGLPADVLLSRPDVIAAEQRLLGAHANIGAARAAFLPKVLLTSGLGLASQGLSGLFSGGAWSFQPTFSLPLFDASRLASSADVAEARKVIAVAEYEKSIQMAFRETADLLSMRASVRAQLDASVATALAQEKRLEIAQARYKIGLVSYLEVLDGQRELVAAQQTVTQVRRARLETAAQLYKALGGGQLYE